MKNSTGEAMGVVTTLGINFLACILVGLFLGKGISHFFNLGNIPIIIGLILGIITAIYSTYKKLMKFNN